MFSLVLLRSSSKPLSRSHSLVKGCSKTSLICSVCVSSILWVLRPIFTRSVWEHFTLAKKKKAQQRRLLSNLRLRQAEQEYLDLAAKRVNNKHGTIAKVSTLTTSQVQQARIPRNRNSQVHREVREPRPSYLRQWCWQLQSSQPCMIKKERRAHFIVWRIYSSACNWRKQTLTLRPTLPSAKGPATHPPVTSRPPTETSAVMPAQPNRRTRRLAAFGPPIVNSNRVAVLQDKEEEIVQKESCEGPSGLSTKKHFFLQLFVNCNLHSDGKFNQF